MQAWTRKKEAFFSIELFIFIIYDIDLVFTKTMGLFCFMGDAIFRENSTEKYKGPTMDGSTDAVEENWTPRCFLYALKWAT